MLTWIQDYWYLCLIALIIGVATGWWIWAHYAAEPARVDYAPTIPDRPIEPVKPEIVPAAPVQFAAAEPISVAPLAAAAPLPAIAPAVGAPDNLELIKGVGPKLNALLISLGVRRFDQIAAWGPAEIAEVDQHLGAFKGRITRDNWIDQAAYLARGDTAGFAAKYGALGSEISGGATSGS